MKRFILLLTTLAASLHAQLELTNYRAPQDVQKVIHHNNTFYIQDHEKTQRILKWNMDEQTKKLTVQHLVGLEKTKEAYLNIKKLSDENYKLELKTRGNGGGWITGMAGLWGTRAVGYGGYIAACWFDPELLLHANEISMTIETTAHAALYAGTLAPTP